MDNQTNIELLKSNPEVYTFIIDKKLNALHKYEPLEKISEEFMEWLSPLYFEAFIEIFKTNKNAKSNLLINKLLLSPLYCNAETEEKIIAFLAGILKEDLKKDTAIYEQLTGADDDFIPIVDAGGFRVLNTVNINILNRFSELKILQLKNDIIDLSFKICDKIKNRKTDDKAYESFSYFIENLPKLELSNDQQFIYNSYKRKDNRKKGVATAISILVIIFIVVKFLYRSDLLN